MQFTTELQDSCIYANVMSANFCQIISIVTGKQEPPPRPAEPNDPPFSSNGNVGWAERAKLAASPNISLDTADCLKSDPHYFVRVRLAANADCDGAILAELANDSHRLVRAAVAANPKTSRLVVSQLTKDSEAVVRDSTRPSGNVPLSFPLPKPVEEPAAALFEEPDALCA